MGQKVTKRLSQEKMQANKHKYSFFFEKFCLHRKDEINLTKYL